METEKTVVYRSPIGRLFEKFSRHKDVSLVYGEPIELEHKRVLPVAKVHYMVGGGGGYSSDSPFAQGEGGGGRISVKPLGVYEIDTHRVTFKPIIDLKFILTLASVLTLGLVWILKKSR
ncbi:hypothetical protein MKY34_10185 [Sporosarcina sp. FSL K6-1522]|uniref:hypothetical protein n=1 Tax=Sporosarcina sp. FSL K6-1522 TaxID=2921554 RepID=UPI00315A6FE8